MVLNLPSWELRYPCPNWACLSRWFSGSPRVIGRISICLRSLNVGALAWWIMVRGSGLNSRHGQLLGVWADRKQPISRMKLLLSLGIQLPNVRGWARGVQSNQFRNARYLGSIETIRTVSVIGSLLGGSSQLGYVVNNHGDRFRPLSGIILQVGYRWPQKTSYTPVN